MGMENIEWPVLRFGSPNCTMLRYDSPQGLMAVSEKSLRLLNMMTENFRVDSKGMRYDLRNSEFVDPPSGLRAVLSSLMGTVHPVAWKVEEKGIQDINTIKQLILNDFDEYSTIWEECEIDELRRLLDLAETFGDLMRVFGE